MGRSKEMVWRLLLLGSVAGLGLLGTTDLLGTVLALLAELSRGLLGLLGEANLLVSERKAKVSMIVETKLTGTITIHGSLLVRPSCATNGPAKLPMFAVLQRILTRTRRCLGSNFIESRES